MSYSTPTASRSYLDHPVLQYDDQHGEIDPQPATLAQVTGERIRDKIAASKKKGIWVGGVLPLGYRVLDRKLVVDEDEVKNRAPDLRSLSVRGLDARPHAGAKRAGNCSPASES